MFEQFGEKLLSPFKILFNPYFFMNLTPKISAMIDKMQQAKPDKIHKGARELVGFAGEAKKQATEQIEAIDTKMLCNDLEAMAWQEHKAGLEGKKFEMLPSQEARYKEGLAKLSESLKKDPSKLVTLATRNPALLKAVIKSDPELAKLMSQEQQQQAQAALDKHMNFFNEHPDLIDSQIEEINSRNETLGKFKEELSAVVKNANDIEHNFGVMAQQGPGKGYMTWTKEARAACIGLHEEMKRGQKRTILEDARANVDGITNSAKSIHAQVLGSGALTQEEMLLYKSMAHEAVEQEAEHERKLNENQDPNLGNEDHAVGNETQGTPTEETLANGERQINGQNMEGVNAEVAKDATEVEMVDYAQNKKNAERRRFKLTEEPPLEIEGVEKVEYFRGHRTEVMAWREKNAEYRVSRKALKNDCQDLHDIAKGSPELEGMYEQIVQQRQEFKARREAFVSGNKNVEHATVRGVLRSSQTLATMEETFRKTAIGMGRDAQTVEKALTIKRIEKTTTSSMKI